MLVLYSRHWQGGGCWPPPTNQTKSPITLPMAFPTPQPRLLGLFSVLFITGWHNVYLFTVLTMFHAHHKTPS